MGQKYDKNYEHILAVRSSLFSGVEGLQKIDITNESTIFGQRKWLEGEPLFRQIIPYILVENAEKEILVYRRTNKSGEKRLVNRFAIGAGGHVDQIDCVLDAGGAPDLGKTIKSGAVRELGEELGIASDVKLFQMSHKIVSHKCSVNMVHVGVVFKICVDAIDLSKVEDKLDLVGFLTPAQIELQGRGINEEWVDILLPAIKEDILVTWVEV